MSFQLIESRKQKARCKDFKSARVSVYCAFSDMCKKKGYTRAPNNINLCTGFRMSPRPLKPTPGPPTLRAD